MRLPRCTATCATALALTLLSPRAARAVSVDVGNFTKNSTTGNQTVNHSLGETPVALILWTASEPNESFSSTFQFGMGLTDGTNSRSAAGSSEDSKSNGVTSRRLATKALTIVDYSQVTVAEADLSSWSSTSFTLNWTTNTGNTGYVVHYLALGGYDVSSKVFTWVLNGSPTGNQSVTGVGFKPTSVLCLHAGPGFTSTPPNSSTHNTFGISVMDDQGNQWANTYMDTDSANPPQPLPVPARDQGDRHPHHERDLGEGGQLGLDGLGRVHGQLDHLGHQRQQGRLPRPQGRPGLPREASTRARPPQPPPRP